jgi:DNA helicase-2/ATP-dependent DNA helicase PcrA
MHSEGPLLVLAGAGSGKTRALVRKIAWLIGVERMAPWQILAVTFTNKAAAEMRERAGHMLGQETVENGLWLGTFHAIGVRLLRMHGHHLGIPRSFVIHDADDSETMVKRVLKRLNIDEKSFPARSVRSYIDKQKQVCRGPDAPDLPTGTLVERRHAQIYAAYEAEMKQAGAVDFSDLIWLPYRLASEVPQVGDELRLRFRYILVDEFQDTNRAQFLLLKALLGPERNVCAVGDDDQSIYRWRGAEVENILEFDREFPGATVIRFEQNYRSTRPILDVSGALIAKNRGRHGKTLFTARDGGEKVRLFAAESESEEADYVVRRIAALRGKHPLREFAIIYRTNAQSRSFEDRLRAYAIPYKVFGGLRFYDRAEIKDVLAYLRLLQSPSDPIALDRILNRPNRGIGATTVARIEARSQASNETLWAALCAEAVDTTSSAAPKLRAFVDLIIELQALLAHETALGVARAVLAKTGYLAWLQKDGSVEGETRAENVRELLAALGEFSDQRADNSLAAWLDEVALVSNLDEKQGDDAVVLLTAHMAKGLEFDVVFVTGMEEDLMPHFNSRDDQASIEEERRLVYVAMTRARHHLHLSHASSRRRFGQTRPALPSRFLDGLPGEHLLDENPRPARRPRTELPAARPGLAWSSPRTATPKADPYADPVPDWENESQDAADKRNHRVLGTASPTTAASGWARGMRCFHPQFGEGIVTTVEGAGERAKVTVSFWDGIARKLIAKALSEP